MKPSVLMIAYACDPEGGGEHWLGWGWAEQAAQKYSVELITTPKAEQSIKLRAPELGITPHFVQPSPIIRKLSEQIGADWWRKFAWQKEVLRVARRLHKQKAFQIVHQTTFHTFRVPFLAAKLGIPSVWGPIAGGEAVPSGFERFLGPARRSEAARNNLNRLWLNYPAVKRSLDTANLIFVSNRVTRDFLPLKSRAKCEIVPPNALRPEDEQFVAPMVRSPHQTKHFKLLYVGNCVATRAMPIVFEALKKSGLVNYELAILGDGPAIPAWRRQAAELGLNSNVRFVGKVARSELNSWYANSDLLVFPALRDSGGSALLEAMARFLPIICLDWAGPGEMIDENSGIKIPVNDPDQTVAEFGNALTHLAADHDQRSRVALAARHRATHHFRWREKREILENAYQRLLQIP